MSVTLIPQSWVACQLGDVVDYGKTVKVEPQDIPAISWVLELEDIEKDSSKIIQRISYGQRKSKSTKNYFRSGDILYGKLRPYLNKIILSDFDGYCSTEIIPIQSTCAINNQYLFFWMKNPIFLDYVSSVSHGLNMPRLGTEAGRNAPLILPPLNEQKRIADKLDAVLARVDACRERLDRVPGILKRFRQSVLAAATSGALTEDETSSWDHGTLRDLVVDKPRNGYSPKSVEYQTSVKSLTLTSTTSGFFQPQYYKYIDEIIPISSYLWLEPGDILIQRANTLEYVGISAIFDGNKHEFIYPDLMMKCKANNKVLSKFLHYLLLSEPVRQHFRDNATGTSGNMPKINQQTVLTAPISWPTIASQHEIVRRVEALFAYADTLEAKYRAAREQVDRLTPAVLAKAFRGELVPQDPNDEPAAELLERIRAARAAQPAAPRAHRTRTPRKVTAPKSARPESALPVPADMTPTKTPPASEIAAPTSPSTPTNPTGTRALADLRKAAGLNQSAVAKAMGLNQAYISQMETGKRPITEAQRAKLAEILGVSVEELP